MDPIVPKIHAPPHLFVTAAVIHFDNVADAAVIDFHYASKGVTFASIADLPPIQWSACMSGGGNFTERHL